MTGVTALGRPLTPGSARGPALRLEEPLSFWGGVDPETGRIVDRRHPQQGLVVSGRVLVLPWGRGSSSSSSVLAECIRLGTAPRAILLGEADPILSVGALVAGELYGHWMPVVEVPREALAGIRDGGEISVDESARLTIAHYTQTRRSAP